MSEEKTEKPTPQRRKENRKKGQVPRTQELGGWATMLLWSLVLPPLARMEFAKLQEIMTASLHDYDRVTTDDALQLLGSGMTHVFQALVLLGTGVMIVGVGLAVAQGGFFIATQSVKPTFSKLNPIQGLKRMFGMQGLWEGAKVLVKTAVVGVLVYRAVVELMPLIGGVRPSSYVLAEVGGHIVSLIRVVSVAGLVLAVADYGMQRRRVGKQTRMTKDEVKREHKQAEGDPLVKSAIRSRQLAASRNRMMADVPEADVVLVNPTHVAVALRYQADRGAPVVVARGAGVIATRIREVAFDHEVPMVRDVPLARALYTATEVGQEIPPQLFAAVAQVLAFVINRRHQGRHGGEHDSPRPDRPLPEVQRGRRGRIASGEVPAGR
ncbi:MAG TPA: EscU/YscU/HrcU family type III secretion system export apparatus switch protein [Nocardioides sp.]|nr:EscU/YscU/HrcU family type III secretion system export apparatus switch protein [Nocardioides sp.]